MESCGTVGISLGAAGGPVAGRWSLVPQVLGDAQRGGPCNLVILKCSMIANCFHRDPWRSSFLGGAALRVYSEVFTEDPPTSLIRSHLKVTRKEGHPWAVPCSVGELPGKLRARVGPVPGQQQRGAWGQAAEGSGGSPPHHRQGREKGI